MFKLFLRSPKFRVNLHWTEPHQSPHLSGFFLPVKSNTMKKWVPTENSAQTWSPKISNRVSWLISRWVHTLLSLPIIPWVPSCICMSSRSVRKMMFGYSRTLYQIFIPRWENELTPCHWLFPSHLTSTNQKSNHFSFNMRLDCLQHTKVHHNFTSTVPIWSDYCSLFNCLWWFLCQFLSLMTDPFSGRSQAVVEFQQIYLNN